MKELKLLQVCVACVQYSILYYVDYVVIDLKIIFRFVELFKYTLLLLINVHFTNRNSFHFQISDLFVMSLHDKSVSIHITQLISVLFNFKPRWILTIMINPYEINPKLHKYISAGFYWNFCLKLRTKLWLPIINHAAFSLPQLW